MPRYDSDDTEYTEGRWKRRDNKKRPRMPVDGASVKDLARLIKDKSRRQQRRSDDFIEN